MLGQVSRGAKSLRALSSTRAIYSTQAGSKPAEKPSPATQQPLLKDFLIYRWNPETQEPPSYQKYTVDINRQAGGPQAAALGSPVHCVGGPCPEPGATSLRFPLSCIICDTLEKTLPKEYSHTRSFRAAAGVALWCLTHCSRSRTSRTTHCRSDAPAGVPCCLAGSMSAHPLVSCCWQGS